MHAPWKRLLSGFMLGTLLMFGAACDAGVEDEGITEEEPLEEGDE